MKSTPNQEAFNEETGLKDGHLLKKTKTEEPKASYTEGGLGESFGDWALNYVRDWKTPVKELIMKTGVKRKMGSSMPNISGFDIGGFDIGYLLFLGGCVCMIGCLRLSQVFDA